MTCMNYKCSFDSAQPPIGTKTLSKEPMPERSRRQTVNTKIN